MQRARIKLWSTDIEKLEETARNIKEMVEKIGGSVRGPIPLPTKKLRVPVMRQVKTGTGHGNAKFDRWEMRIHRRALEIGECERALHQIIRLQIPDCVNIEVKLREIL
ncbi:MAG: 30S ribosomal protein S10 [Candidatus Aenigmarchaeota archaeon ex4484_56]|nr:MAG: 30S ribosomal protein S10 [Candidatus Aenigmarchaeota archaeon ex4484_56]